MLIPSSAEITNQDVPIVIQLIRAGKVARAMLDAEFGKIGLSFPYGRILTTLEEKGPKSATELCVLTMRERANMSVLLGKMKKIGYITETPNPLDARSQVVSLTEAGKQAAQKCRKMTEEVGVVVNDFVDSKLDDPSKFRSVMAEFLNKFYSMYA
ncbi:MAG: winged helix DNA-binding protein [Spirochaetes bacterium]|nr:winged helix DNA-binding protein [Spirochaetota bacterium]